MGDYCFYNRYIKIRGVFLKDKKGYFIGEILVIFSTLFFIINLYLYNKILHEIQDKYTDKIIQAIKIVQEPKYFTYLVWGVFFIILLVGYTIFVFRRANIGTDIWWFILINLILLIILLIVFWNPILTTFAALLITGGVFIIVNT